MGMAMSIQIDAGEAQVQLLALLDRVVRGEEMVITQQGRAIARLVPVERASSERRREAIERLKEFGKGRTLGVPVKQLIDEGRMRLVRKFL
jgi:prevent-host-death family protein